MELIRAKMLIDGFSCSGNYAHEAEVSYLRRLGFVNNEIFLVNELRGRRNSITYYGKILNKEYAEKCYALLNEIYPKLTKLVKK